MLSYIQDHPPVNLLFKNWLVATGFKFQKKADKKQGTFEDLKREAAMFGAQVMTGIPRD